MAEIQPGVWDRFPNWRVGQIPKLGEEAEIQMGEKSKPGRGGGRNPNRGEGQTPRYRERHCKVR